MKAVLASVLTLVFAVACGGSSAEPETPASDGAEAPPAEEPMAEEPAPAEEPAAEEPAADAPAEEGAAAE